MTTGVVIINNFVSVLFFISKNRQNKIIDAFCINFEKINKKICQNRPVFYKTLMAKDLCLSLPEGDRILIVDFDILFQNNFSI